MGERRPVKGKDGVDRRVCEKKILNRKEGREKSYKRRYGEENKE